jgi:hypothetical protein
MKLIKDLLNITPKDVREAVQFDPAEYDEEGSMAKVNLRIIIDAAKELHDMVSDDENLPEWAQAKLTLAEDYMISVRDYMKHRSEAQPKNPRDIEPLIELGEEEDNGYIEFGDGYDGDDYEGIHNKPFYVAFYDTEADRSWIGKIEKIDSKWHEKPFKGKPSSKWGGTYMGYLQHDDIMSWIRKDYSDRSKISGPFDAAEKAEEFVKREFGKLD